MSMTPYLDASREAGRLWKEKAQRSVDASRLPNSQYDLDCCHRIMSAVSDSFSEGYDSGVSPEEVFEIVAKGIAFGVSCFVTTTSEEGTARVVLAGRLIEHMVGHLNVLWERSDATTSVEVRKGRG